MSEITELLTAVFLMLKIVELGLAIYRSIR
ncbi:hypothetical protein REJC140_02405 [Pseudorhizobium endolithicum]|uniref:Uncharacterized protein n=1 Tax=Pseudorhizobium endolithicum TaxID=1191678 RepID=A0ABN7JJX5_9HYPH|nr:hypothetical protein REJC140_02405 [Pseudorhizobium endolithicum]